MSDKTLNDIVYFVLHDRHDQLRCAVSFDQLQAPLQAGLHDLAGLGDTAAPAHEDGKQCVGRAPTQSSCTRWW